MVRVMATGVFDILHSGHLHYLREAKKMGDELWVVVACDETVRKMKHEPITPAEMRREIIAELKMVDHALLGRSGDRFDIVRTVRPDVIALGYDQKESEETLHAKLKEIGLDCRIERVHRLDSDLNGTRKIIQKIVDWWQLKAVLDTTEGKNGRREPSHAAPKTTPGIEKELLEEE